MTRGAATKNATIRKEEQQRFVTAKAHKIFIESVFESDTFNGVKISHIMTSEDTIAQEERQVGQGLKRILDKMVYYFVCLGILCF